MLVQMGMVSLAPVIMLETLPSPAMDSVTRSP